MFTDVKNFVPNQALDITITVAPNHKAKGKIYKLFKPLLRILRRTAKNSTSNQNTGSVAHPNNVNLNNCRDLGYNTPATEEALVQDAVAASYEDYAAVIRKVAKDEDFLQTYFAEDPFSDTTPYALDTSASKSQPMTACDCSHGYNCRQYHRHLKKDNDYCQIPANYETTIKDTCVPVHYVRTDDGTFFWTAEQIKLDEDLMEPVYCSTVQQHAQAQWDYTTMLY